MSEVDLMGGEQFIPEGRKTGGRQILLVLPLLDDVVLTMFVGMAWWQLAFRSSQALLAMKKDHIRRVLHITPPTPCEGASPPNSTVQSPVEAELERQVELYLRRTVEMFDLTKCGDEVCSQIWATLYDYPCLKDCPGLVQYVRNAVRLSWGLVNQSPPFILEYEQRVFRKDVHVRFHTSDPESDQIRTYLWPALSEGCGGPCVHKAVKMVNFNTHRPREVKTSTQHMLYT
uniref:Mitochondria-eating protein n=1 Tax=Timema poppense TaxID=170557 RepID=A0A7R9GSU5_TIMPO|nr:unnamed protein product [Timema poppensis]